MSRVIGDFAEVQDSVWSEIFRQNGSVQIIDSIQKTLKEVCEFGEDFCTNALGEMGTKLYGFASNIDLSHPDLNHIMTAPQCNLLSETLKLYSYAKIIVCV